jgi:type IV pilus assembly protein PilM
MASIAWGIDIGNRALKAVKLQRTAEGVKMTDFAAIEHDTILSEAGDDRDSLVQTSLARFAGRHDTKKAAVAVSVSGQQSFARFVKLPPVEPKKLPEIVRFEAVQQIPFPLDDVEWSYQLFERDDDPEIEVGIFAMRKELVNEHVQQFVDQNLDVLAVQTSPLAVYNAVRADARLEKGHAVILDLGAESTDMIVASNDDIWMRSLDVGGNAFTEALAKAFKVDFAKAEEMKRGAKASKYAKQIYQAMRPVFGELVGEVQKSLGFYQSSHRETKVRKIICLGGGFKLNGLSGYLQKNLQMPVEKPQRFNVPGPDDSEAAAALSENTLSGTAAYGLALQALGEANVTSSLLPTHIRQDKLWRDKTKYFVASGAMVGAAALLALGSLLINEGLLAQGDNAQRQISQVKAEATRLSSEWQTEVASAGGEELQTVRNVGELTHGAQYWPGILADLFAALPGPKGDVAQALAGQLGDPEIFDDADKAALEATPRDQRAYVEFLDFESEYTDNLGRIIDDPSTFYSNAEALLAGRTSARVASDVQAGVVPVAGGEIRRGFVVRLRLLTPLTMTGNPSIYDVFGGDREQFRDLDLTERLLKIAPDADRPKLSYQVVLAGMSAENPLEESASVVNLLEAREAARQALVTPEEVDTTSGSPTTPQRGRRPSRGGFGDRGDEPFGDPRFNNDPRRNRNSRSGPADANSSGLVDPITEESRAKDTVFEVLLAIQLDPPAFANPEAPSDVDELSEPLADAD